MAQTGNVNSPPKKLRILCLHGYNTNIEIMKYQVKNFEKTFEGLCEFTFIQGIYDCPVPPISFFVKKGIQPPYKRWMLNKYKYTTKKQVAGKVTVNYLNKSEVV